MPLPRFEGLPRVAQPVEGLRAAFDEAFAESAGASFRRHLSLAGRSVTLASEDGGLLGSFARAFRHLLADEAVEPALTILLTSIARLTGVVPELGPTPASAQPQVVHADGGRFVAYHRQGTLAGLDRAAGRMVVWCGEGFPASDRGQPLFALFAAWLHDLDLQLVHAGLVASGESGALLGGAGGSGKSTTALACMRAGLTYLGDDSIALSLPLAGEGAGEEPWGFSLYASARLEAANLERFPELIGTAEPMDPREPDKLVLYPLDGLDDRQVRGVTAGSARLAALLLPHVTGGAPRAVPLAPAKALLLLAPSSIRAMAPQPMVLGFERLARLVESVPCYRLEVGEDLAAVANEVERVLTEGRR